MTSRSGGWRCQRARDCDWLLPGLLPGLLAPSEPARSRRWSEASPAAGGSLGAAVDIPGCPSCSHRLCFPGPACSRQPGTVGCACSSAGEVCWEMSPRCGHGVGKRARGAGRVSFLRGLGISSSPPLSSPGQRVTVASLHLAACDTSEGEQLLVLVPPQPAARSKHGRSGRVELPHLPRC